MRLLDAEPLRNLPRAQALLLPVVLVLPELLEPLLRDVCLDVLALTLARLPMLIQDLHKLCDRRSALLPEARGKSDKVASARCAGYGVLRVRAAPGPPCATIPTNDAEEHTAGCPLDSSKKRWIVQGLYYKDEKTSTLTYLFI